LTGGPDLTHRWLPGSLLCFQTISALGGQQGSLESQGAGATLGVFPEHPAQAEDQSFKEEIQ